MKKLEGLGRSLRKEEQKRISGGVGGTCQALISVTGGYTVVTGLTMASASQATGMVRYCCDSCSSATWSNK